MVIPYRQPGWDTIDQSPTVVSASWLIHDLSERLIALTGDENLREPLDIRRYVGWEDAPIEAIRAFLEWLGLPSGRFLGEQFERRVQRDLFEIFESRNHRAGLRLLEEEASIKLISYFDETDGLKTHLQVCASPTPFRDPDTTYTEGIKEWINWIIEWWADDTTVTICVAATAMPILNIAASTSIAYPIKSFTVV